MKENKLTRFKVKTLKALRGAMRHVLVISYPWQGPSDPDSTGDRLVAIGKFLEEHEKLSHVWWDFPCLPQGTNQPNDAGVKPEFHYPNDYKKTAVEKAYFSGILNQGVNTIYLGGTVLSILTAIYTQRFWPQFEFVLANRAVTENGFEPSCERSYAVGIQSLEDSGEANHKALHEKWFNLNTAQAKKKLGADDTTVTNPSDKEGLLGKMRALEAEFSERIENELADEEPVVLVTEFGKHPGFGGGDDDDEDDFGEDGGWGEDTPEAELAVIAKKLEKLEAQYEKAKQAKKSKRGRNTFLPLPLKIHLIDRNQLWWLNPA